MKKIYFLATCCLAMCLSAYSIDRGIENGHAWVDLGLPSGTKWATCNVGARTPQGYGNHYAWGETRPKKTYDLNSYLDGRMRSEEDYGTSKDALKGVTDIAGTRYDAARANWGGKWRMPTNAQWDELLYKCYWVWTESYNGSGVKGYIVYKAKSSSDKGKKIYIEKNPSLSYTLRDTHIFLPAADIRKYGDVTDAESGWPYGIYWSSMQDYAAQWYAWGIHFSPYGIENYSMDEYSRHYGQSVRAVCK